MDYNIPETIIYNPEEQTISTVSVTRDYLQVSTEQMIGVIKIADGLTTPILPEYFGLLEVVSVFDESGANQSMIDSEIDAMLASAGFTAV